MARWQYVLAALWWGSLMAVGFMVVPLLFVNLETPAVAGRMAAKLFTAQSWLSVACGLMLLLAARQAASGEPHTPSVWVVGGVLLALLLELAVAPRIVARENLMLWHNVGSIFYLLQCACAAKVMWQLITQSSQPITP